MQNPHELRRYFVLLLEVHVSEVEGGPPAALDTRPNAMFSALIAGFLIALCLSLVHRI